MSDRRKLRNRNEQWETKKQNNIMVYNLTEDVGKLKEKELVSKKLLKEVTGKNRKRNPGNVQNWQKSWRFLILSQNFSKKHTEECKKLFSDKVKEINQKGGSIEWVVRIRGQPSTWLPTAEDWLNQNNIITFLFFDLSFVFWILMNWDLRNVILFKLFN